MCSVFPSYQQYCMSDMESDYNVPKVSNILGTSFTKFCVINTLVTAKNFF